MCKLNKIPDEGFTNGTNKHHIQLQKESIITIQGNEYEINK